MWRFLAAARQSIVQVFFPQGLCVCVVSVGLRSDCSRQLWASSSHNVAPSFALSWRVELLIYFAKRLGCLSRNEGPANSWVFSMRQKQSGPLSVCGWSKACFQMEKIPVWSQLVRIDTHTHTHTHTPLKNCSSMTIHLHNQCSKFFLHVILQNQ